MADKLISVIDGRCVIYKRANTPKWQVRIRHDDGYWERKSTGEFDADKAKTKALTLFSHAMVRAEAGIPPVSRKFEKIAKLAIQQMQDDIKNGCGKKIYKDYIAAIEQYFIPYFGKFDIQTLRKDNRMRSFEQWRLQQMNKTVMKKSTVTTHNAALKRVFQVALDHDWVNPNHLPKLNYSGEKSQRRPTFSMDEYVVLTRRLQSWATSGYAKAGSNNVFLQNRTRRPKPQTAAIRELLRDYVIVLANTGIRHGTEMFNMRWCDIEIQTNAEGNDSIVFTVNGKRGENRQVVGRANSCLRAINRVYKRSKHSTQYKSLRAFLKARVEDDVWVLRNGEVSDAEQLARNFEQFLTEIGMLKAGTKKHTANRTLYSFRHFYATNRLLEGIPLAALQAQMGTSLKMLSDFYNQIHSLLSTESFSGDRRDLDKLLDAESLPNL